MAGRRTVVTVVATATTLAFLLVATRQCDSDTGRDSTEYTVVAEDGVSAEAAVAAITAAGGTVVRSTDAVGMFQVQADADFASRCRGGRAGRRRPRPGDRTRPEQRGATRSSGRRPPPAARPATARRRPAWAWTRSTTSCGACAWSAPTTRGPRSPATAA